MSNDKASFHEHGPGSDQALLLVISAASGTGKTTLARRLVEEVPNSVFSVSCTTRALRGTEQSGLDYTFLSSEKFREMLQNDAFAEWAEVHGHFYGTPRSTVDDALKHGKLALFDIDVQGGEQLRVRYPMTVTVFVLPPSYEELARRLKHRSTDSDEQIQKRLLAAESEIRRGKSYDYIVVNDDLERTIGDLKAIIRAERLKSRRYDPSKLGF